MPRLHELGDRELQLPSRKHVSAGMDLRRRRGAITQTSCLVGTESNSAYVASTCAATLDWSNSTLGGCPAEVHEAITFDVNGDFTGTMRISATCAEDGGTDAAGASVVCVYPITSIQPLG